MSKIGDYVKSSYDELVHKTSWPTFQELQSSAIVVAVAALILALIVFLRFRSSGYGMERFFGILLRYIQITFLPEKIAARFLLPNFIIEIAWRQAAREYINIKYVAMPQQFTTKIGIWKNK